MLWTEVSDTSFYCCSGYETGYALNAVSILDTVDEFPFTDTLSQHRHVILRREYSSPWSVMEETYGRMITSGGCTDPL